MNEEISIAEEMKSHPAWHRLENQREWYFVHSFFRKSANLFFYASFVD